MAEEEDYKAKWLAQLSINERLGNQLEKKDTEITKLERKVDLYENDQRRWTEHRINEGEDAADDVEGLPVPRLQLRYVAKPYGWEVWYELVYRHFLDGVGNGPKYVYIPMGVTKCSGGHGPTPFLDKLPDGKQRFSLPFREGAHIKSDARQLKLPAYAIHVDVVDQDGEWTELDEPVTELIDLTEQR